MHADCLCLLYFALKKAATPILFPQIDPSRTEAGVDEAGRGCLAGPVVAAAVILPPDFDHPLIQDSKKLSHPQRLAARQLILDHCLDWGLGMISAWRIDEVNILNASFEAMTEAVKALSISPDHLAIDGNRFRSTLSLPFTCVVKGDGKYRHIAAASILAKTFRDEIMEMLHGQFPAYHWAQNKGYPTQIHREALAQLGPSPYHRLSFGRDPQLSLF